MGGCGGEADAPMSASDALREPSARVERVDHEAYASIVRARGGAVNPQGRVTVLGIRGLDVSGRIHDARVVREYDDTLVVLRPDGTAFKLAVSTHPWETRAAGVPDVDGDRTPDVGMIRPGEYAVARREASRNILGKPTFAIGTQASDRVPGWRDTNHDGVYDERERAQSESRGDTLTGVLFHQGGAGAPAAVGCQVLADAEMRAFAELTAGSPRFNYVLVDARDLAEELPR